MANPWDRITNPVTIDPDAWDTDDEVIDHLTALPDEEFALLIGSNLLPRHDIDRGKIRWQRLWRILRNDDDLADRTFDLLDDWLDRAEQHPDDKRARKFAQHCRDAWSRLETTSNTLPPHAPLAWAGRLARRHPPQSRYVIDQLVTAIVTHRDALGQDADPADRHLWDILTRLDLDPDRH